MVNYEKLQNDILKDFFKGRKCKNTYMFDLSDDKNIYIVVNGVYIIALPRLLWYLDINKIIDEGCTFDHNHKFKTVNILSLINNCRDFSKFDFKEYKILKDNKKVAVFSDNENDVCINTDLLKYYDIDFFKMDSCYTISGKDEKSPIMIHDSNRLIGVFLPIVNCE